MRTAPRTSINCTDTEPTVWCRDRRRALIKRLRRRSAIYRSRTTVSQRVKSGQSLNISTTPPLNWINWMPSLRLIKAFDQTDFVPWLNDSWPQYYSCHWVVSKDVQKRNKAWINCTESMDMEYTGTKPRSYVQQKTPWINPKPQSSLD